MANKKRNKVTASTFKVEKKVKDGKIKIGIKSDETLLESDNLINIGEYTKLDGLREQVFLDRYSLKDAEGKALELYPDEMWRRVAKSLASEEKTTELRKEWEDKFYSSMKDFKFVPAGRILSGAGTGYEVTYFNCYVIPDPKDSRGGIMESITQTVEIQSRAGGVGLNLSSLRPNGARVRKVNGSSSGPVNWANLYSTANHDVIQQGGSRRGALMLMLHDWHPDIEEFIHVKEDLNKIPGANLSVCVSDKFMEAVKSDSDWDLVFPDLDEERKVDGMEFYDEKWEGDIDQWVNEYKRKVKVYKTVKARDVWDQICTAAWTSAEPGLHFLERSNKWGNTWYYEKLIATNPCVTADTWVHTSIGPKQVKDLIDKQFIARVNGEDYVSESDGFFKTGNKEVFELSTVEGYSLKLTADHKVMAYSQNSENIKTPNWVQVKDLKQGDQIVLHNHRSNPVWKGKYNFDEGYVIGMLIGDGTMKSDKVPVSIWNNKEYIAETKESGLLSDNVDQAYYSALTMPHRKDFKGFVHVKGRNKLRMTTSTLTNLADELGLKLGHKTITSEIEKGSSEFCKGVLRGIFDADGSVQRNSINGWSIRLAQSNIDLLKSTQRMLLRFGIISRIYENRRDTGSKLYPDGNGGKKIYAYKVQHELIISKDNIQQFQNIVGFAEDEKSLNLVISMLSRKSPLMQEKFTARVKSIELKGKEDVYDVTIAEKHSFDANSLYVSNCGEQILGPWAVCNLGALNLSVFVKEGKMDYSSLAEHAKIAIRLLDNAVDGNFYFYEENKTAQLGTRRTGLGTMGLGDALIKMKLRYGSDKSLEEIKKIYSTVRDAAYEASSDYAKEKGSFTNFIKEKYLKGYFIQQLPKHIQEKIEKQGIRNAIILTQAPTGTTSLLSGASSGIEPVYDFVMKRVDRIGEHLIYHPLLEEWKKENPNEEKLPEYFVGANDLTPEDHVKVQSLIQYYTDSSISKTVNAPNSHTIEDVKKLYMMAYDMGCKGISYFRDGSRFGVLSHIDEKKEEEKKEEIKLINGLRPRPEMLSGKTYKVATPIGKAFISINDDEDGNIFEVFINVGKAGSDITADAEAMGRLISLALRVPSDYSAYKVASNVVEQLRGIGGSSSLGLGINRVKSLADAVGKVIDEHINNRKSEIAIALTEEVKLDILPSNAHRDFCPSCGQASLVYEEGCQKCHLCGFSKC